MHFTTPLIAASLLASATALPSEDFLTSLLKRQAPGTPEYICHAACGGAITASRGDSPCEDMTFLDNYADCLVCAGPENFDIWKYYGGTLTGAGDKCGLSTEPEGAAGEGETVTSTPAATTTAAEVVETSSAAAATTTEEAAEGTTTAAEVVETLSAAAATTTEEAAGETSSASAPETTEAVQTSATAVASYEASWVRILLL
jgi:hypothetical protein